MHNLGSEGSYSSGQAVAVIILTVVLYAFFLYRQTGPQRTDFQEVEPVPAKDGASPRPDVRTALSEHRGDIAASAVSAVIRVLTVLPIVLLSHDMATMLDEGVGRAGVLITAIVFLPETIIAVRAAFHGEIQRVSNLCHGALVSAVGLTTGLLTVTTFTGRRITALHGAAHVVVFLIFGLSVFS